MNSPPAPPGDDTDHLLAELLEDFAARLQAGETIDLEACAREHPEHADRLRWLLPAAQALADLSRPSGTATSPTPLSAVTPMTGTLGDFRILREVGRGGMGVVYEAEQISLGRRVALKVLPAAAVLDPRHLRRFQNEARAAACLHHPNIVPVYSVSSDRGVHYYAMQFIEGRTLAALIEEARTARGEGGVASEESSRARGAADPLRPRAEASTRHEVRASLSTRSALLTSHSLLATQPAHFREVARLGMEAAEALDYAHQQGIVHRDVKPANFMVDAEGRLWVADFGLAHMQGHGGLTATGDLLGTLRYMSPEQTLGKRGVVDHRTDVYSLGLTLYEVLALQPAFPGEDRQELLVRIAFEDPIPVRRLNPAIPADLETVLGKAMAKEPVERYATARELADDLRRFLDDRPVLARRPTAAQRVRKWARRHVALVRSLALSVTLLGLGGILGLAWYAVQQHDLANQRDEYARRQHDLANQRAEAAQTNELKKREVEAKLYRALLAQAAGLRRERQPGYRRLVWEALQEAAKLKVASDGGAALRTEVLACLGDPIGLEPVKNDGVRRRPAPVRTEQVHQRFERLRQQVEYQRQLAAEKGQPFQAGTITDTSRWEQTKDHSTLAVVDSTGVIQVLSRKYVMLSWQGTPFGQVHDIRFTEDGKTLVAGCEEGVLTWQIPSMQMLTSFRAGTIHAIDVHPGGRVLATAGRQLNLWSLTNHRLIASFTPPRPGARVEFSADGKLLLAVVGNRVEAAWPVTDTPEKRALDSHQAGVPAAAFSPDGALLASGSKDNTVRIWDVASGRLLHTCQAYDAPVEAVAFSPDGKLIASGDIKGNIAFWSPDTGKGIASRPQEGWAPPGQVWRLQFSPTGSHLVACGDLGVAAWGVRAVAEGFVIGPPRRVHHPARLIDLAVHPDGPEAVFLDRQGRLSRWNVGSLDRPRQLTVRAKLELRALHFDPTGIWLTFIKPAGTLGLLEWRSGAVHDTNLRARHLALSPDGRWVATPNEMQGIVLYDLKEGRTVLTLPREEGDVWSLAWSADGRRLAVGMSDGGMVLWDLEMVRTRLQEFGLPASQPPFRHGRPPADG
jgi:serine/threonine protein kinase/WD40 repeat protein